MTLESPDIIIWVQGRATSNQLRSMIRDTYGNKKHWPHNMTVTLIFFIGKLSGKDAKHQVALEYEFDHYGDIVQSDFPENYRNQVSKMVSAINYITDYCNQSKLILRIDDDVIFHPRLMFDTLSDVFLNSSESSQQHLYQSSNLTIFQLPRNTIACHLISDFEVWRKKDHPKHFNAVDDTVLPGEALYPPFCAGFFVAMSGDVPGKLRSHIATNKPFWMDDRYMGVLQKRASINNINISPILDFGYKSITSDVLDLLANCKKVVRHLPGKQKFHISQLYRYLDLSIRGLKGHFETIK
ncbi:hypothetical protein EB796_010510 [Bugula neritina]|uniref:Hexosyltransferase n=1 Tax=Bugula neritina TaxID=10212 RepID=A0A7J7JXS7_BUGNE|nr:hypothetical protein EB796_010510 [Bugula neritina]